MVVVRRHAVALFRVGSFNLGFFYKSLFTQVSLLPQQLELSSLTITTSRHQTHGMNNEAMKGNATK
jgi:hypothetical protein